MTFWQQVEPFLIALAPIVLPILFSYLTIFVKSQFEKMPTAQRQTLFDIVTTAVRAVEQTEGMSGLSDAQKKTLAMQKVHDALTHYGLTVPDSVIDPMIEEAVLLLNMAQGKGISLAASPLAPVVANEVVTSKEGAIG